VSRDLPFPDQPFWIQVAEVSVGGGFATIDQGPPGFNGQDLTLNIGKHGYQIPGNCEAILCNVARSAEAREENSIQGKGTMDSHHPLPLPGVLPDSIVWNYVI